MSKEFSFGAKRGAAAYMLNTTQYKENCKKLWHYLGSRDLHITPQDKKEVLLSVSKLQTLLESSPKELEKLIAERGQTKYQIALLQESNSGNVENYIERLTKIHQHLIESKGILKLFNELHAQYFDICKKLEKIIKKQVNAFIDCNEWIFIIAQNGIQKISKEKLNEAGFQVLTFNNIQTL